MSLSLPLTPTFVAWSLAASLASAQSVTFQPRADFDLSDRDPIQSATADFDLDGNLDLIVSCEGQNNGRVSVLWGDGSGDYGSNTDVNVYLAWGLVVDDFNGDGWPDFAVTSCGWAQHGIGILFNDHQRGFIGGSGTSSLGTPPVGLASADFDHDGDVDLAVANNAGGYAIDWFKNNGNGYFGSFIVIPYSSGLAGQRVVAGDFDNDGWADLALSHSGGVKLIQNIHQSYEWFHTFPTSIPSGATVGLAVADMNRDGNLDIVTGNGLITVWYGAGDGSFPTNSSSGVYSIGDVKIADVDGDTWLDVVGVAPLQIAYGSPSGLAGGAQVVPTGTGPTTCMTGDFDNDGRIDIATACNNNAQDAYVSVHLQTATPAPSVYCTSKWSSLGCVPTIGFSGAPHSAGNSPFHVTASAILNQKAGLLIYGFQRGSGAFQGGVLCISGGVKRTQIQSSGGSTSGNNCSGSFDYDMQARIQGGSDPLLATGVKVDAQYWYRDPADPFTSGLSNALEFVIAP